MLEAIRALAKKTAHRLAVAAELAAFLRARKAYWLAPIVIILLSAALIFFLASATGVTPFIYTLF